MTTALDDHISVDQHGVARIARTRMKVVHLVKDQMAHGSSPEELRQAFPSLTLSQIYAALTYYHDHKSLLDAQIEQSSREAIAAADRPLLRLLVEPHRAIPTPQADIE